MILVLLTTGCGDLVTIRSTGHLDLAPPAQTSVVVAGDGSTLAELHAEQDRDAVPLTRIPQMLRDAVVAVEDTRFYDHPGIDARALGRALLANIQAGGIAEGGSTITQQLAKNAVTGGARTLDRKLAESSVALQLEQRYSKDEILERYLNTVYFGNGAYGVQTAARRYFATDVEALTLPQAALLAGLLQAPSTFDPYRAPVAARARRDLVLDLMREQGRADDQEVAAARATPLTLAPPAQDRFVAPYFVDHVLDLLQHDPTFAVLGEDPSARADRLFRGGLRIETTLDPHWQDAAEAAVAATLPDPADPRAAVVAIDPATGGIRSLVGGRDYDDPGDPQARFNLATDGRRQPGSAFKPLVLAAALAHGHTLDERFPGGAQVVVGGEDGAQPWVVDNYEGHDPGPLSLAVATAYSVNTVYARLADDVGPEAIVAAARAAGIRRDLRPLLSLALGAQEVSALEMASVQATLAAGGLYRPPSAIRRILDADGGVVYERGQVQAVRALDAEVAAQVTAAMEGVVEYGTGARADLQRPTAGKTGTTQDGADAWFVGYTPDLAAAVWVGFPQGRRSMDPPATRIRVEGGNWPAELFARFGLRALQDVPAHDFVAPGRAGQAPPVDVPDVVGLPADAATRLLTAAGFTVQRRPEHSVSLPPGYVIAQRPAAGRQQRPDSRSATLVVSSADRTAVTVPDVLNLPVDDAVDALEAAGLGADVTSACPGADLADPDRCTGARRRPGRVWEQVPDAEGSVPVHTRVRLSAYPDP